METDSLQSKTVTGTDEGRPWLYRPGVSGNPNGRPRKTPMQRQVEQLTRAQAQAAVERLMAPAIARVEKALKSKDEQTGLRAALSVLDRGLGLPTQRIEGHISADQTVNVTPEMLRMAAQRLLTAQAVDAVEVPQREAEASE